MRALVCRTFADPPEVAIDDLPDATVRPGAVVIEVRAAGVNFLDSLIIRGTYQVKPPLPFAPGAEVAGVVSAVGEGVTHVHAGDRVVGMSGSGGFAEYVTVEASNVLPMPAGMDFVTAAAFMLTYGTSYHGLVDRAQIKAGEKLLVLGAGGGVGLAAVEIGHVLGAHVVAAAGSYEKLEAARERGATDLIDYRAGDFKDKLKAAAGPGGYDVIYDAVGGDFFDAAMRHIAWAGRMLVVGFAAGRIPEIAVNKLLLKSSAVMGVYYGAFAARDPAHNLRNVMTLGDLYAAGKLAPIVSGRYPLERAAEAIDDLASRKIVGKAVVIVRP